jgi:superfamily I DNA/RNA helicase
LFSDGSGQDREMAQMVVLATVHKFKGMEADRVFVLDAGELMPSAWARMPWELEQEKNLMYVAATRAIRELRYITSEDLRREP